MASFPLLPGGMGMQSEVSQKEPPHPFSFRGMHGSIHSITALSLTVTTVTHCDVLVALRVSQITDVAAMSFYHWEVTVMSFYHCNVILSLCCHCDVFVPLRAPQIMDACAHVRVVNGKVYFRYGGFMFHWFRLRRLLQTVKMIQASQAQYGVPMRHLQEDSTVLYTPADCQDDPGKSSSVWCIPGVHSAISLISSLCDIMQ